jgi:hypothetical protein
MWYYSVKESIKKLPKLILFVILSFVQKNNRKLYTSYSFLGYDDPKISNYYFLTNIKICTSRKKKNCDCLILIQDLNYRKLLRNIFFIKRMRVVGINYFGHYGMNMLINTGYFDFSNFRDRDQYTDVSFKHYHELKEVIGDQELYVLGNAPDFSSIIENIKSKPVIICNDSINIIEKIHSSTVILAFGDPLFHFSYDENALNFIKKVKKIENFIDFLIVPSNVIPILKSAGINTKLIGVTSSKKLKVNFLMKGNKIYTKNTHNVMTQYMLPLATSLSNTVNLGAVSFELEKELESVWDYDQKIIDEGNKNYAFEYSFFKDRNFKKYYKYHNKMLNNIIKSNPNIKIYE